MWNGTAIGIAYGGTGQATATAGFNALSPITTTGDLILGNGTNSATRLGIGTNGYVLTVSGGTAVWAASTASGVSSFTAGTTGFTPSTATTGAVTLAGTLATTNGGTGLTSFTSGGVVYASSTSALATGSALVFDGSNLGLGVTPSAWNVGKAIEVGSVGNAIWGPTSAQCSITQNTYYNGGFKYGSTAAASYFQQLSGVFAWYTAPSGTAGTAVSFTQSLSLGKGTTLVLENGTSSSGTGIAFPATQSASSNANTLDDYEEGTWTPTLSFGGASVGIVYTGNAGTYTKIGRLVTGRFILGLSSKGSSTGDAIISGLPFTLASDLGSAVTELASGFTSTPPTSGFPQDNTTFINLWSMGTTGITNTNNTNFSNSCRVDMWFQYFV